MTPTLKFKGRSLFFCENKGGRIMIIIISLLIIGIFASLDPVALDQCCYDQIMSSTDSGKKSLVERMQKLNAIHIVEESHTLNIGSREYELICID